VVERLPLTLELAVLSMHISECIALSTGVLSAIRQDTWVDSLFRAVSIAGLSVPNFWLGTLIILILSRYFASVLSIKENIYVEARRAIDAGTSASCAFTSCLTGSPPISFWRPQPWAQPSSARRRSAFWGWGPFLRSRPGGRC